MAISEGYKANFETLKRAADDGALCIVECKDKESGKTVIAVCAAWMDTDEQVHLVPVAKMFDGDPYAELEDPISSDEAREGSGTHA